jgi:endoglucanase
MTEHAAARWGGLPHVIGLEPLVEPNRGEPAAWNAIAARLVAALRRGDPDLPALISPLDHGAPEQLPMLEPVPDRRTIYSVHQYGPWQYTHQAERAPLLYPDEVDVDGDGAPDTFSEPWLRARIDRIAAWSREHDVPIAITEFGVRRWAPDAAAFLQDQIAAFEHHGWAHALWMWHATAARTAGQDEFDVLRSSNPADHQDHDASALLAVVRAAWLRNGVRAPE